VVKCITRTQQSIWYCTGITCPYFTFTYLICFCAYFVRKKQHSEENYLITITECSNYHHRTSYFPCLILLKNNLVRVAPAYNIIAERTKHLVFHTIMSSESISTENQNIKISQIYFDRPQQPTSLVQYDYSRVV
jgi:hypothetical protein